MKNKETQSEIEKNVEAEEKSSYGEKNTDIAIVGMACRFPGAKNYREFWENIKQANSSISEIPDSRWDWKAYWGDPQSDINKSNSKWGGFIEDVDAFDLSFFGFSPREVEAMDPQQRIMLELTWSCLEDAGICPSHISGQKVGVYVGVFNFDYKELQERKFREIETYHSTGTASAVIANRISHYYNLKGPSFPIDAACSGSLNAIHSAIQALTLGDCNMALAGGINLLLTPTRHISFSKTGMLSPTGSCKTFDESADGYVRSEGAGVVLLKPLKKALEDGDSIYGILKGSAINHNGKTHTLTYPNPDAQAEVIAAAHRRAAFSPDSISYIEAHGTGTPKGDPIEFQGLIKAFDKLYLEQGKAMVKNCCGLGSVKTNIGHLEAAAGIAGVIKVLLCMKYKQLPKLQNLKSLNHRITVEDTPFYFLSQTKEWKPAKDEKNQYYPKRAGVSSFGFGGTNAHVVMEEAPSVRRSASKLPFYLIGLSAKTEEAMRQRQHDLLDWLESKSQESEIIDISSTLLLGREHFEVRSALVVKDIAELKEKLSQVLQKGEVQGYCKENSLGKGKEIQHLFEELGKTIIKEISSNKFKDEQEYHSKLLALAELYVNGGNPDWKMIFADSRIRRANLPTYPFAKDRYWLPQSDLSNITESAAGSKAVHPLVHYNTSYLSEQRFTSTFTGKEHFLADHVIGGKRTLPGAAYLEMARKAVELSIGEELPERSAIKLKNIVWASPITVDEKPVDIHIALFHEENGDISFDVYNKQGSTEEEVVHSQGSAVLVNVEPIPVADIHNLQRQCSQKILTAEECYKAFENIGFQYGHAHRAIEKLYMGERHILAKLCLPSNVLGTEEQFMLHPSMIDAAIQASIWLLSGEAGLLPYIPFALQELEIHDRCTSAMWAYVAYHNDSEEESKIKKIAIDLYDEGGRLCLRMKGFSPRLRENKEEQIEALVLEPVWREQKAEKKRNFAYSKHLVLICGMNEESQQILKDKMEGVECVSLEIFTGNVETKFTQAALQAFQQIKKLLEEKIKGNILVQAVMPINDDTNLFEGLSGLLKTASRENPKLYGQVIAFGDGEEKNLAKRMKEDSLCPEDSQIHYENGKRMVLGWNECVQWKKEPKQPWKDEGIYLITGGAGGLGLIFAKEIASNVKNPVLILTGRSALGSQIQAVIDGLVTSGAKTEYRQADVTEYTQVESMVADILQKHGRLDGIIHAAGIVKDSFIIKKKQEEFMEVLAPKVLGLANLDRASGDLPIDLFISFSSIMGAVGNVGQADYATANAFMDSYAEYRNNLVKANKRCGRTLSINWPLWKNGGMHVDEEIEKIMRKELGMVAMETMTGMKLLYRGFERQNPQILVVEGDGKKLREVLTTDKKNNGLIIQNELEAKTQPAEANYFGQDILKEKAVNYFKKLLSAVIKLPANSIDAAAPMEKYGIDSILVMQLTNQLEKTFGSLPKTLFFEYKNIQELAEYFLEGYREQLVPMLGIKQRQETTEVAETIVEESVKAVFRNRRRTPFTAIKQEGNQPKTMETEIAIIGLAGRYPGARNVNEFWENLKNGKDCITEIPKERWDYHLYFDEDKSKEGKTYSKWGGFIEDVDCFDPLFFNISPREAERMDPQERLFLQCVYEAIQDAGYTREALSSYKGQGMDGNIGVYVGVMYDEYQLYGAQEQLRGRPVTMWGIPASVANRVSYYCNFHGPSMTIDTMCSSSITAIHLACQVLKDGNCEMAIAGGVNISIHPNKYLFLSQGRFVSSNGRCESFGQGGDGYVPGEGVGAVLLKPLRKAVQDGDHIYGVIKGTAINHGGKTNGYTVPNPNAQASVVGRALKEAGVHPRWVSYIEAHGTGTSLGDPIEIAGLLKCFDESTKARQYCAIGSAKSNIGHCESAAGIAGITKVLLQMKHRQIAPSLHSSTLNPNIEFKNTPFTVQQELTDWKRPSLEIEGRIKEFPRIAGISSFGAGGSNGHVVIEEFQPEAQSQAVNINNPNHVILVMSAKNNERLKEQLQRLIAYIQGRESELSLTEIAYTLQVGREAMEERLAVIAGSLEEAVEKLQRYTKGENDIEELYYGQVRGENQLISLFVADEDMVRTMDAWIEKKKYGKLAEVWVKGFNFDWNKLYGNQKPQRISLPTYPFARERYWLPEGDFIGGIPAKTGNIELLHPLVHQNTSDLSEQRFTSVFTGEEFFLTDHIVNGRKTLPGAAYLEMAKKAVELAAGRDIRKEGTIVRLSNIAWNNAITVDEKPVEVHITLFLEDNGSVSFEVYSQSMDDNSSIVVHSQGSAAFVVEKQSSSLDIKALIKQCSKRTIGMEECYQSLNYIGLQYGRAHRGIETLYIGENQVLAKICLPSEIADSLGQFELHPSIVDAALQASLWVMAEDSEIKQRIPFALKQMDVYAKFTSNMWAYTRIRAAGAKMHLIDIDLCDETGRICACIKGFSPRAMEDGRGPTDPYQLLMLEPLWQEQKLHNKKLLTYEKHLVVLCGMDADYSSVIQNSMSGLECVILGISGQSLEEAAMSAAADAFEQVQGLLKQKLKGDVLLQVVVEEQDKLVFSCLSGLLKTAVLENPRLCAQMIEIENGTDVQEIISKLKENGQCSLDKQIRYQGGKRMVAEWREIEPLTGQEVLPWKDGGVYLITGGAGGLGLIFAKEVVSKVQNPVLVLIGRSEIAQERQKLLDELKELGATVQYRQVDITCYEDVKEMVASICKEWGSIDGILHGAGLLRDGFIIRKSRREFMEVLAPKVSGLVNLDRASREIALDFFVLFSSVTGAIGNTGQADYSAANAFMDAYAAYRNELISKKERSGRTLSINWPLWKDGGMHVEEQLEQLMLQKIGMAAMKTQTGVKALYRSMTAGKSQVMVMEGDLEKLRQYIGVEASPVHKPEEEFYQRIVRKITRGELSEEEVREMLVSKMEG